MKKENSKNSPMPSVLIIGGAGFMGTYLVEALLKKSCFIYCLDRAKEENNKNMTKFENKRGFRFIKAGKKINFNKLRIQKFDYIFYLNQVSDRVEEIKDFLDLAKKQTAKFLLLSSYEESRKIKAQEELGKKYYSKLHLDIRIVRLVDLYGPGMDLEKEDELSSILTDFKNKKIMKLSQDGSQLLHPLYIDDAVRGLMKTIFSQNTKGKIYSLGGLKISLLKLANLIKKNSLSALGVEFKISQTKKPIAVKQKDISQTKKQLNWQPKIELKEGLKETLDWLKDYESGEVPLPKKGLFLKRLIIFILTLALVISLPLGGLYFYKVQAKKEILFLNLSLENLEISKIKSQKETSLKTFERGRQILVNLFPILSLLPFDQQIGELFAFFDEGTHLIKLTDLSADAIFQVDKIASMVIQGEEGNYETEVQKLDFLLDQLWENLNLLEARQTSPEIYSLKEKLPFKRKKITLSRDFVNILSELVAVNDKKTYLVLLQNNLELRPTGGFIGSFGLLSFEKGRLLDFQLATTMEADKQLKGQIDPPLELEKYLGEKSWYLRDSNWSPHYPISANQAEWFYEKEMGRQVDGVIGLDLYFLKDLLKAIDSIKLEETGDTITSKNILERAQYYEDKNNDFMLILTKAIFQRIEKSEGGEWLKIIQSISSSLDQKNLLLTFHDKNTGNFVNQNGFDGSIRSITSEKDIITDYLMINEANLGVNKANFYLKREIIQEVTLKETGELKEKTSIVYENMAESLSPPGGNYKNYLRVYLPRRARIETIKTGENSSSLEEVKPKDINNFEEHGKKGIGILLSIPIQEKRIVEISYQIPSLQGLNKDFSYALYFQKQPGMGESPLRINLSYGDNFQFKEANKEVKQQGSNLSFEENTLTDELFLIEFSLDNQ